MLLEPSCRGKACSHGESTEKGRENGKGQSEGLIRFHGGKIRGTQGYTTVRRGATVDYHGTATDDDGASTDTHGSKQC